MTLGRGSEPRSNLQGRRGENEESRQVIGCPSGLGWGYLELNEWREQQTGEVGRALLSGLETWVCYLTPPSLGRKGK